MIWCLPHWRPSSWLRLRVRGWSRRRSVPPLGRKSWTRVAQTSRGGEVAAAEGASTTRRTRRLRVFRDTHASVTLTPAARTTDDLSEVHSNHRRDQHSSIPQVAPTLLSRRSYLHPSFHLFTTLCFFRVFLLSSARFFALYQKTKKIFSLFCFFFSFGFGSWPRTWTSPVATRRDHRCCAQFLRLAPTRAPFGYLPAPKEPSPQFRPQIHRRHFDFVRRCGNAERDPLFCADVPAQLSERRRLLERQLFKLFFRLFIVQCLLCFALFTVVRFFHLRMVSLIVEILFELFAASWFLLFVKFLPISFANFSVLLYCMFSFIFSFLMFVWVLLLCLFIICSIYVEYI